MIALALVALTLVAAPEVPKDPVSNAVMEQLAHGLPAAEVGQWVTYKMNTEDGRGQFWRLAVVGSERDQKGRDAAWVEMEMSETAKMVAPLFQMKLLVARDAKGLKAGAISRVIMAAGMGKPQELDAASVAKMNGKPKPVPAAQVDPEDRLYSGNDAHMVTGKSQKVMTLAGTLEVMPVDLMYRKTVVQRFWVSKQIPVLQLAKIEIPGIETGMEVRDYGLDAKPMMRMPQPGETELNLNSPIGDAHAPSQP